MKTDIGTAIMCPNENCCGILIERIVGAPQCDECSHYYTLNLMSDTEVADMLRVIHKVQSRRKTGTGASHG